MENSTEKNIIAITIEAIKNDNLTVLDKCLKIMPVENLDKNLDNLLVNLLAFCANYTRSAAAKLLLERWKVAYPDNDRISILPRLFLNNLYTLEILAFLTSIFPDYTYVELIDELISWDSSPEVIIACNKGDQIFSTQPLETYKILRLQAQEAQNYAVEEYLMEKIAENSPYAPIPPYIKNYLAEYLPQFANTLPTDKELYNLADEHQRNNLEIIAPEISNKSAVEMLTAGLSRLGITINEIENAKTLLLAEIEKSPERKKELLEPIWENLANKKLEEDSLYFWVAGPSNRLVNQNLTLNTPSSKYGGCRMFLCDLFDYDEEADMILDWFIGYCQQCLLKIKYRHHAVRQPRPHGGWQECFCSFTCLKTFFSEMESVRGEPDIITHDLIEQYQKEIERIGIQDRRY